MSDEPTPLPVGDLFAPRVAPTDHRTVVDQDLAALAAPDAPVAAPLYTSRRELRAATAGTPAPARTTPASPRGSRPAGRRSTRPARPSRAARAAERALKVQPTGAAAPRSRGRQNPAIALLVVLVVPGFVVSTCLPAFAFQRAGAEAEASLNASVAEQEAAALPAQEVTINEGVADVVIKRDTITATTEAELRAQQISAATFATLSSGPRAAGDDYPWAGAGYSLSPLNYYYRQCVDFVAWRLNRDAGVTSAPWKYVWSNLTPNGGNASQWYSAWQNHNWKTSSKPIPGAVAWFNGNHVAYVKSVAGSNVVIEEYNGMSSRAYAIRTIPSSSVAQFLYPPPR